MKKRTPDIIGPCYSDPRIPTGYRKLRENAKVRPGDMFLCPAMWRPYALNVDGKPLHKTVGSIVTAIRRIKK